MPSLNRSALTLSLLLASAHCAWAQAIDLRPSATAGGVAAGSTDDVARQPAQRASATTLPAVTVTATKQDKPAFETPGSVSLIDGEAAETQDLRSLSDVAQQTPNVYFTDFTGSAPTITVRGLGFSDDESDSTSTSVLIDGVPVLGLALGTLFDLEQIEVLRGPQSTLYGQSSMGGILALRTRDPGFSFGGTAQMDVGTGHRRRLGAATDLPLSSDTALRLAVGGEDADGYVKNTALGRDDTGRWRSRFARLKILHLDPSGGEWRLGLHHVERDGGNDFFAPAALARRHVSTASDAGTNDTDYTLLTGAYARRFSNGTKLNVTLGGSTALWDYWLPRSLYGGPSGFHTRTRQYSAEARLSSEPAPAGGFDWLVGTYASSLKKNAPYLFEIPGYMRSSTEADIEGRTAAVFGELGWRFAPSWRLAGALRYEHDRRRINWRSDQRGYYDGNGDGLPDTPYAFSDAIQGLKVHDNMLMPRLTLEFRPDAQQFAWATLARGYKASGFNLYATEPASAGTPYAPEYGNYAELGYRTRAADNSWEFGGTAFYTRLRDQQVVVIGRSGQSLVSNAGRSHNVGVELTGTVRPSHTLEFSGFAGYVKAVYDEYVNGGVDYAGEQFPNTPRHSVGVAVNWKPALAWNAGLSVRRMGASHLYPNSRVRNDAYTLVDAHLDYRFQRWTLGLYGKNLGNATYFTRALGDRMLVAAQPRTVGLRASIDF